MTSLTRKLRMKVDRNPDHAQVLQHPDLLPPCWMDRKAFDRTYPGRVAEKEHLRASKGRSWVHRGSLERTVAACSVGILLRIVDHFLRTLEQSNWVRYFPSFSRERRMVAGESDMDHLCRYFDRYDLRKVVLIELDPLFQMIHHGKIHRLHLGVRRIR